MTILKAFFKLYLLSFLMLYTYRSNAQQLSLVPLESNPVILKHLKDHPLSAARNNQVCPTDTLTLPFFDDFATTNIYPNCSRWQDNHVFINADMAYNPPSVGVATFDGLSPNGSPYDALSSPALGKPADTLTSQHINLSGKTSNDAIFLSFFYQKQGLSDRPEVQDSFILEFKDINDVWVRVWEEEGVADSVSSNVILPFEQQYIAIDSTYFLYDGFQFRFRNLAAIAGNNDHWHLDYVMLDENRTNNADTLHPTYGSYADVAFTHRASSPLKDNLTAMPWRHFDAATCWGTTLKIQNYNHNHSQVATLDRQCTVNEISPNTTSLLVEGIPAVGAYGPSPNTNDSLTHTIVNNYATFNPIEKTVLETTYTILNPSGFQSNPIFEPNDTTRTQTVLDNYFAYDDGTAETRIIAQGLGTKIAVEYKAEVTDTLQGIYIHLPYFRNRDAERDFVNIKVWVDSLSNDSEVFSRDLHHLRYRWGFNGFYFVDLVDYNGDKFLIPLHAGQTFYVGWQQSIGTNVPVGFDRSTDNKDKTWVGVGSTWTNSTVSGSVMIRPLLSPDSNYTLIPVQRLEEATNNLTIYPNPTKDILNLELEHYEQVDGYTISIHNALGQIVYTAGFEQQLNLGTWNTGLYILTLRNEQGKTIAQQKIIKH
ncbi:T9SS type A sorting domain-containing protein [Aureispira anguillae]|uniref:T9SS type A sorting domain-containing protein n=1 Tax=Aureispira anguillae TaxID=2864201 RepID=A0A915YBV6_9BACT|nr:T9SS type A sorting domain-containing protein [Aureispira anguillae]BDS10223.1 T9SS type A sorting domain-containing protein [Aureispira anguillae]